MAEGSDIDTQIEHYYTFKLIAVGDPSVGKTSILERFAHDKFDDNYKTTLGVEFMIRNIDLDSKRRVKMQVWDTAGQERYAAMTSNFYRGSHGILIVFDLSRRATFDNVTRWFNHAQWIWNEEEERFVGPLPITKMLLIGNKMDKKNERKVTQAEAEALANEYQVEYVETSAKSGEHVLDTFIKLSKTLFNDQQRFEQDEIKRQDELIKFNRKREDVFAKKDQESETKSGCCK